MGREFRASALWTIPFTLLYGIFTRWRIAKPQGMYINIISKQNLFFFIFVATLSLTFRNCDGSYIDSSFKSGCDGLFLSEIYKRNFIESNFWLLSFCCTKFHFRYVRLTITSSSTPSTMWRRNRNLEFDQVYSI